MIRDVDTSLAGWLSGYLPPGAAVVFDPPGERPSSGAALALYLHEVREEADLTVGDWSPVRDDVGHLVARLPPQRRYRLTYLLTAWAESTLDEHGMLGGVLAGCAEHHSIPQASLHGCLVDAGLPVLVRCAPADRRCDPSDLWSAWHIPPRTALELSVLAALPVTAATDLAPAPSGIGLNATRPPGGSQGFVTQAPPDGRRRRATIGE